MKKKYTIALLLAIVFSMFFSFISKWVQTGNPFQPETLLVAAIILLNIFILGIIATVLFKKFASKPSHQLKKLILPGFLTFVVISLVVSLSLVSMGVYAYYRINEIDTANFIHQLFYVELSAAVKQLAVWILIGSAIFFYIIWRKTIDREQKLREENLRYKYQSLKSQVNPHFLFNTLNTLSELVYDDAAKADKYIQKLSTIYRYILENEETDLIGLSKEVRFVQEYFDLQKIRDGEKIALKVNIPTQEKFEIVPISLQILVENALKHNSRSEQSPLFIRLTIEDNHMSIRNNIQRKNTLEPTSKIGLKNLKERIKLITGRELMIQETKEQFVVKLPIIEPVK